MRYRYCRYEYENGRGPIYIWGAAFHDGHARPRPATIAGSRVAGRHVGQ